MTRFGESDVEDAALAWLESLGWNVAHGPDIAPDALAAERAVYGAVLVRRILRRHGYPSDKREEATRTVLEQAEVLSEGWALAG